MGHLGVVGLAGQAVLIGKLQGQLVATVYLVRELLRRAVAVAVDGLPDPPVVLVTEIGAS